MRKSWIVVVAILSVAGREGITQDSTAGRHPWLSTVSIGFPEVDGDLSWLFFTVGANFTRIRPGVPSPDVSVGTMPIAFPTGIVPVGVRGGVALPMQISANRFLLPSAGLSAVTIFSRSSVGGVTGTNVGLALASRDGVRIGLTWHRFADHEAVMLLEIGAGQIR